MNVLRSNEQANHASPNTAGALGSPSRQSEAADFKGTPEDSGELTPHHVPPKSRVAELNGRLVLVALVRQWLARFDAKVRKTDTCWQWTGALQTNGYGSFGAGGGSTSILAHRFAWERAVGPIPTGLTIDHLCMNTKCVNPAHFEVVTVAENASRKGRSITHCKRGHELAGANLYVYPNTGKRGCRICRAEARAALALARVESASARLAEVTP
jgi:hypothetical protein